MSWDLAAVVLALLALALRWWDDPRSAALCGYASTLCSYVAARRSRAREHATADAD